MSDSLWPRVALMGITGFGFACGFCFCFVLCFGLSNMLIVLLGGFVGFCLLMENPSTGLPP